MTTPAIPAEEREINLLLALRNTAEGLTAAEIIKRVSGYNPAGGGSARRMFERDKDILRQIGVPLRASGTGDQCRYRIEEEDYALAPLRLVHGPVEEHWATSHDTALTRPLVTVSGPMTALEIQRAHLEAIADALDEDYGGTDREHVGEETATAVALWQEVLTALEDYAAA